MPTQNELQQQLDLLVRSSVNGEKGNTTAADVRAMFTLLINELYTRTAEAGEGVLAQATGTSTTVAMSQKATTDALGVFAANPAHLVHPDRTRDYFTTVALAIAAAAPGDTLVLPAPVSDSTISGNEAQAYLSPGLSLHTEGFDVGSLLTAGDALTLTGGRGKLVGKNSRVYSNSAGAWGLGAYQNATPGMFYEIYDLHFINQTTCAVIFNSDCDIHFYNCNFNSSASVAVWGRLNNPRLYFHNCNFLITGTSHAATLGAPTKMVFENCLIQVENRTTSDHLLGTGMSGEIHLISTTVLAENNNTSAVKANLLLLDGNTVIRGTVLSNQIIDQRPERTSSSPINILPQASAGADSSITLPTNTVSLTGSGTDSDGTIATYKWVKIAGPNSPLFSDPNVATPVVSGLIVGSYTFQLTVTDNQGGTATDDVVVTVNPAVSNAELLIDSSFEFPVGPTRWQAEGGWYINPADGGNAITPTGTGKIWQYVELTAGITYQVEIEVSAVGDGGIFFEFTNANDGSGKGYFRLGVGTNKSTYTPATDEVRQFSIKGNAGFGTVSRASLKAV